MSKDKIRIVATDGDNAITLGFINCGKHYVFGQVTEDSIDHSHHHTYHENGYMHLKWMEDVTEQVNRPQYYGPPLDDFQGLVSTASTPVLKDLREVQSPNFVDDKRSYDNITYVDTQNSIYGMEYQPFICEPGFPVGERVENYKSNISAGRDVTPKISYQVYTETEPWVGVAYWQHKSGFNGLGATPNFRPMGVHVEIRSSRDPYSKPCTNGNSGCDGPDGNGPLCKPCYERISSWDG